MKMRITQALVDSIEPRPEGDIYVTDDGLTGFRLRVTFAGSRILFFQYRAPDGRQRKINLGSNVEQARRQAKAAAAKVAQKQDPQAEADARAVTPTLSEAAERYIAEHVRENLRPGSVDLYEGTFKRLPEALKTKKLCDVTAADIGALMRSMKDRKQGANGIHAILRAFFSWCLAPDVRLLPAGTPNPAEGVKRYPAVRRSFVFEGDQLYRFNEALNAAEATMWPPAIGAMRLLLFTGMRREEVLNLKWNEVDLDARKINLKQSKTGARPVPLGKEAIAVLEAAKALSIAFRSEYVFPSPSDRSKPIVGFRKMWLKVIGLAGMPGLRIHDLRHNYGGMGAAATRSAVHVKGLLGHSQLATTDRYMALAENPLSEAADEVNEAISQAMQPKNVVTLRRQG